MTLLCAIALASTGLASVLGASGSRYAVAESLGDERDPMADEEAFAAFWPVLLAARRRC